MVSAHLAQAGGINLHRHGLAQDVQQHHDALFGIGHPVGRLQPGKRAFGDDHRVALVEKWLGGLGQLAAAQHVNQGVVHLGGRV